MKINLKTKDQITQMRVAGRLAADVLEMITPHVVPGMSTEDLDKLCHDFIVNEQKAIPANVGYNGFKKTICSSVNQVICHGIPSANKVLKDGDILNIDVTVIRDGWHGDTSKMFLVGKAQPHNERLVRVTQECLYKAIDLVRPGAYLGDIGAVIQEHATQNHYSVVEDYCGHGIGQVYHEDPQVLHYGKAGSGLRLEEG
ncbi:type I methionyl aminopeptidase, partial [Gammaproteobacteria bacterium]|nr:type I methionyl aminopeptidase [Gammaproteobacteria bacterium]